MKDARSRRLAVAVYRGLLHLYPPSFRRRFGRQMVEMFADAYAQETRRGLLRLLRLWSKTLRDVAANGPAVWLQVAAVGRRTASPIPTSRRSGIMQALFRDLRYAARTLAKTPTFTLVAVTTLVLGIGANSAIFSVVHGVMLRPLPYPRQDELVFVWTQFPEQNNPRFPVSSAEYLDYRAETKAFVDMGAFGTGGVTVMGDGAPERVTAVWTTASLFQVLGATASIGRLYTEPEDRPGAELVTVLSHGYWTTRYGADPSIVGRGTITVDGTPFRIIGVLPREFQLGFTRPSFAGQQRTASLGPGLYFPLGLDQASLTSRSGHYLVVVGRLASGTPLASARAELHTFLRRWQETYAGQHTTNTTLHPMTLVSVADQLYGDIRPIMWLLLAAVGLVLLLACANVANLALARGETRVREIGIRRALGAARRRVAVQLMTENLLLAVVGGTLGLALAWVGTELLLALEPGSLPRAGEVSVDWTVVGFTLGISVFTGLLFGTVPALRTARADLTTVLRSGRRGGSAGRESRKLLRGLVVAQVALAVLLLIGSGLLIKSFVLLNRVDPGFDPEHRIGFDIMLSNGAYPERDDVVRFHDALLERLAAVPGVSSVAAARGLPMREGIGTETFVIDGRPVAPDRGNPSADYQTVTGGYFATMAIPMVRGREFTAFDRADAPPVALINEAAATRYFPGENPVGRRIQGTFEGPDPDWRTIVGVVGDVRQNGLDRAPRPELYLPLAQTPPTWAVGVIRSSGVVVRTELEPEALGPALRQAVASLDPGVPVANLGTLEEAVSASISSQRFVTVLLSIFAMVAVVISAVGVYGVIAFSVARRTQEIGIRLALGADPNRMLRSVVASGVGLAALGGLIGIALALVGTRLMQSLLFGVAAHDVGVFTGGGIMLLAVALAASLVPARRASVTDPTTSLRAEG